MTVWRIVYSTADVQRLMSRGPQAVRYAVRLTALDLWGGIRKESPVDEGVLANSWQLLPQGDLEYLIRSGVHYALLVHNGRGPVVAQRAKALRFRPKGTSAFIFRKSVGPAKANRYVDRAMEATEGRTDQFIAMALAQTGGS